MHVETGKNFPASISTDIYLPVDVTGKGVDTPYRQRRATIHMQGTYFRRAGMAVAVGAALAIIGGIVASTIVSAQTPNVSISSLEASAGSQGKVTLAAHDIPEPGLSSWSIDIYYDPKLVSVKSCGATEDGLCNPEYDEGVIRVVGSNIDGHTGKFDLASIIFTCNEVGKGKLELKMNIFADATIGHPEKIDASTSDGKVDCTKEPTPTPTPVVNPGDVNCDESVDPIDATLVLQYVADLLAELPCPQNADLDEDGEITAKDAMIILQMSAGLL